MLNTIKNIFEFLEKNGFKKEDDTDMIHFYREDDYGIDFDKNNLDFTIIAEDGDIHTIPLMKNYILTKCMIAGFFTLYPADGNMPGKWKK